MGPTPSQRAMRNCMVDLQALTGRTLREEEWAQLPPNHAADTTAINGEPEQEKQARCNVGTG